MKKSLLQTALMIWMTAAFLFGHALLARAGQPIALHPDNPHYFLWNGKPAVLVTSGEHYGAGAESGLRLCAVIWRNSRKTG